jgi:hypothetical protein
MTLAAVLIPAWVLWQRLALLLEPDRRALYVRARAEPVLGLTDFLCDWGLRRAGESGDPKPGPAQVESRPAGRTTKSNELMLFIVPKAGFGSWVVNLRATAKVGAVFDLARRLSRPATAADFPVPSDAELCAKYSQVYKRFLEDMNSGSREELKDLLRELKTKKWQNVEEISIGGLKKVRKEIDHYLTFRRFVMIARVAEKLGDGFESDRQTALSAMQAILAVPNLVELKAHSYFVHMMELRSDYSLLAKTGYGRDHPDWGQFEIGDNSTGVLPKVYYEWRDELIFLRTRLENRLPLEGLFRGGVNTYLQRLQSVLDCGAKDCVLQLIAAELRELTVHYGWFTVELEVWRGTRGDSGAGRGSDDDNERPDEGKRLTFLFQPMTLGAERTLGTIVLDKQGLRVTGSPK